jgi:hypothetical protein
MQTEKSPNDPHIRIRIDRNDENCIQSHFYDATVSKTGKLLMVSDFNENLYLGVFWSEKLVGNDEICIQGNFFVATIFKMPILLAAILETVAS